MILNKWSKLSSSQAILKHNNYCNCEVAWFAKLAEVQQVRRPWAQRGLDISSPQHSRLQSVMVGLVPFAPLPDPQRTGTRWRGLRWVLPHDGLWTARSTEIGRCWSSAGIALKPVPFPSRERQYPGVSQGRDGRSVQLHCSRMALERDISTSRGGNHHLY